MLLKQVEERLMQKRSALLVDKAYHELQAKAKAKSEVLKHIYKQVMPTFTAGDDSIWADRWQK